MKRILLLSACLCAALPVYSQGFTVLSYRMGALGNQDDAIGLTEYRLSLPGPQLGWKEGVRLGTTFGYHHADFGSDFRFWGNAPMDSWMAGASLSVQMNEKSILMLGSAARFSRLGVGKFTNQRLFHQSGLTYQRAFRKYSLWIAGVAYRNGVVLSLIPIVGFQGRFGASMSADILLPGKAYIWKELSSRRALGLFARYQTTPYPGPVVSNVQNSVLRHRMIRTGLAYEEVIAPRWSLRADVAATVVHDRKLALGGDAIELPTDAGIILDIALVYRVNAR